MNTNEHATLSSETPLEREIKHLIAKEGPIGFDRYMDLCLGHPVHGYYRSRDPFGAKGDFITAPEVSQMYGELIGVWCVDAWDAMGRPETVRIVELGPGRGTLMTDLVRSLGSISSFQAAIDIHLVETSPVLKARQAQALDAQPATVTWHETFDTVPQECAITIASEFFDALPVRQFEQRTGAWFERVVGLGASGGLSAGLVPQPVDAALLNLPDSFVCEGDVWEFSSARIEMAQKLAAHIAANRGACLIIDYGHTVSGFGATLQAVRDHRPVSLFAAPGDCDLTSHVDFESLGAALAVDGNTAYPPITQRNFLRAMGLEARAAVLRQKADPATQREVDMAVARLADCDQMGNLFKVCAVTGPGVRPPFPFGEMQP